MISALTTGAGLIFERGSSIETNVLVHLFPLHPAAVTPLRPANLIQSGGQFGGRRRRTKWRPKRRGTPRRIPSRSRFVNVTNTVYSRWNCSRTQKLSKRPFYEKNVEAFNRILWGGIAGNVPYPAVRSRRDLRKNRAKLLKKWEASRISHMAGSVAVAMLMSPSEGRR